MDIWSRLLGVVLLDIHAAFHTIDLGGLRSRLCRWVGISGTVVDWFVSYLANRKFMVSFGDRMFLYADVSYEVPQESVLGPICFHCICSFWEIRFIDLVYHLL